MILVAMVMTIISGIQKWKARITFTFVAVLTAIVHDSSAATNAKCACEGANCDGGGSDCAVVTTTKTMVIVVSVIVLMLPQRRLW